MDVQRKIIHIDMDAFYASVEQRDFPEYRGKSLVVGGSPEKRGVVATASYEARKFGVKSAMSCARARQLCPGAIFVYPRFEAYKEVSRQIREIFSRYTDLIEPLSLDEAYLDVSNDLQGIGSAIEIAKRIKAAIKDELQLTASAGVSVNKFVAKIASDMNKPDGLTFIGPSAVTAFMEQLPVEKFFGVGKVTAARMNSLRLFTGADLKRLSELEMIQLFGKSGRFYYQIVRGIDHRPVHISRQAKSLAAEDTFDQDLSDKPAMRAELEKIAARVAGRLEKRQLKGRTLTLKVKFSDFRQITRSYSQEQSFNGYESIFAAACHMLDHLDMEGKKVRLLGLSLSNFQDSGPDGSSVVQLSLF
jgi:DNA polymerase-4